MPKIAIVLEQGLQLRASVPYGRALAELNKGEELEVQGHSRSLTVNWLLGKRSDGTVGWFAETRRSAKGANVVETRFARLEVRPDPPDVPAPETPAPIPDHSPLGDDQDDLQPSHSWRDEIVQWHHPEVIIGAALAIAMVAATVWALFS